MVNGVNMVTMVRLSLGCSEQFVMMSVTLVMLAVRVLFGSLNVVWLSMSTRFVFMVRNVMTAQARQSAETILRVMSSVSAGMYSCFDTCECSAPLYVIVNEVMTRLRSVSVHYGMVGSSVQSVETGVSNAMSEQGTSSRRLVLRKWLSVQSRRIRLLGSTGQTGAVSR